LTNKIVVLDSYRKETCEVNSKIECVLHEKKELVEVLMGRASERKLYILKELMIDAYVAGFFSGTNHFHKILQKENFSS